MKYQLPTFRSSLIAFVVSASGSLAAPKSGESNLLQLYGRRLDNHEARISELESRDQLPPGVQTVSLPKTTGKFSYTVKSGETIHGIARKTGVNPAELMRSNGIRDERSLRAGQVIQIPGKTSSSAPQKTKDSASASDRSASSAGSAYKVRSGDNLYKIAKRFGVSASTLAKANRFSSADQTLRIGQMLTIPGQSSSRNSGDGQMANNSSRTGQKNRRENYEITGKETFYSLSRQYNVSVEDLTAANPGVNPNALRAGMRIVIPARVESREFERRDYDTPVQPVVRKEPPAPLDAQSLHGKGKKNVETTQTEVQWRDLDLGETGALPSPTATDPYLDYEVQPGETWETVSRDFYTQPAHLKTINKSKSAEDLKPGEFILVPRDYLNKRPAARSPKLG